MSDKKETVGMEIVVSKCCGKPVRVAGEGQGTGATHWYECLGCGKPCDLVAVPRREP